MRVMVFVKATKESEAGVMPKQEDFAAMGAFNEQLIKAGIMEAGEGLKPSSNGARVRFHGKQRTVVDGPFAETKELVAGFWIWKCKSLDEAIAWAKKCPSPHPGQDAQLEIRPFYDAADFANAPPEVVEQEKKLRAAAAKKRRM